MPGSGHGKWTVDYPPERGRGKEEKESMLNHLPIFIAASMV